MQNLELHKKKLTMDTDPSSPQAEILLLKWYKYCNKSPWLKPEPQPAQLLTQILILVDLGTSLREMLASILVLFALAFFYPQ